VAARAGVSGATVSRYFNSRDVVRPQTRQKIEIAARELGYIRDRMAGVLHGKMSGTIGLIVPTIDNAIFSELIEAFADELHQHDRTMLIASHNYDLAREVGIVRSLLERRIDAVALVGHDHDQAAIEMLKIRGIPVLTLWSSNRARDRKAGALDALQAAGIDIPEYRDRQCTYDMAAAKELALTLLKENAPSAFVCGNDVIAHGVIHAAIRLGIKIPEQLSVVGIGDFRP